MKKNVVPMLDPPMTIPFPLIFSSSIPLPGRGEEIGHESVATAHGAV